MKSHLFQSLLAQVTHLSFLHYYILTFSDEWGEIGKDHIQHSFARLICRLDIEDDVSYDTLQQLEVHASKMISTLEIDKLSLEDAKEKYKKFQFNINGTMYPLQHLAKLNDYIRDQGETYFLQGGYYGHDIELILGAGEWVRKGAYSLYTIKEEFFHTPNTIIPMAAVIGNHEIFVRERTLYIIFQQKWLPVLRYSNSNSFFYSDPLSDSIKRKCISYYATNYDDFYLKRDEFVQDLTSIVLQHECGHAVIQHNLLSQENATFGEAMKLFDENCITVLLEVLADIAPLHNEMHGPLQEMVDRSKHNQESAERLFYMYVSDTYFYDTADIHMYQYSDLITAIMASLISENGVVDFETLQSYLVYKDGSLVSWMLNRVNYYIEIITNELCRCCFDNNYDAFKVAFDSSISDQEDLIMLEEGSYEYSVTRWVSFFTELIKRPSTKQVIQSKLDTLSLDLLKELLKQLNLTFTFSNISEFRAQLQGYLSSVVTTI